MSARETEAYLLARDVVRRIQRTTPLVEAIAQRPMGSTKPSRTDRRPSH